MAAKRRRDSNEPAETVVESVGPWLVAALASQRMSWLRRLAEVIDSAFDAEASCVWFSFHKLRDT
jgi:hypothetical protein